MRLAGAILCPNLSGHRKSCPCPVLPLFLPSPTHRLATVSTSQTCSLRRKHNEGKYRGHVFITASQVYVRRSMRERDYAEEVWEVPVYSDLVTQRSLNLFQAIFQVLMVFKPFKATFQILMVFKSIQAKFQILIFFYPFQIKLEVLMVFKPCQVMFQIFMAFNPFSNNALSFKLYILMVFRPFPTTFHVLMDLRHLSPQ